MFHQCRQYLSIASKSGCKGDSATIGHLFQVQVLEHITRNGIIQGLYAFLQWFGILKHLLHQVLLEGRSICQNHYLVEILRGIDILIILLCPAAYRQQGYKEKHEYQSFHSLTVLLEQWVLRHDHHGLLLVVFQELVGDVLLVDDEAEHIFAEPTVRHNQTTLLSPRGAP